jgi:hypothetical protein
MFEEKYIVISVSKKKKKLDDGKKTATRTREVNKKYRGKSVGEKNIAVVYFNHEVGV